LHKRLWSLSSNHTANLLALSAFCALYITQKLIKLSLIFCSVCRLSVVTFQVKPITFDGISKSSAVILDFLISQGSVATQLR